MKKAHGLNWVLLVAALVIMGLFACRNNAKLPPQTRELPGTLREDVIEPPADNRTGESELPYHEPNILLRPGYLSDRERTWTYTFDRGELLDALERTGAHVATLQRIEVAQRNAYDCATTLSVGGTMIGAYDLKQALGLDSTCITEIRQENGKFVFSGRGVN